MSARPSSPQDDPVYMFDINILLSQYSSYKIGGPARFFYAPEDTEQVIRGVKLAKERRTPIFILGGGTNLVINDNGFNGLVLKPNLLRMKTESPVIVADAGVLMADLLDFVAGKGLSGLEWAGGLPGTLGGAIRGNAGAFGGEIKDVVAGVTSLDIFGKESKIVKRNGKECRFSYRNSIFKERDGKEIILSAVLNLKKGDKKRIRETVDEKIQYRKKMHPMEYPNVGSIFKNTPVEFVSKKWVKDWGHVIKTDPFPVIPTAYIISEAGLKGVSFGGAMISPKHPNFIVNTLGATAGDVKALIDLVKKTVKAKFGLELEEEVMYI